MLVENEGMFRGKFRGMVSKMVPGKLLVETGGFGDLEYLTEGVGDISSKKYFIYGPVMEMEKRNRNGRIYEAKVVLPEIDRFVNEKIKTRRALGRCDHPKIDSTILASEASHVITELKVDGNIIYGKAEILDTQPYGRNVKVLMDAKIQMAVSTRSLGSVDANGYVGENLKILTYDIVNDPSSQIAFVESILESQEYIIQNDKLVAINMEQFNKNLSKNGSRNLYNDLNKFLTSLSRKI